MRFHSFLIGLSALYFCGCDDTKSPNIKIRTGSNRTVPIHPKSSRQSQPRAHEESRGDHRGGSSPVAGLGLEGHAFIQDEVVGPLLELTAGADSPRTPVIDLQNRIETRIRERFTDEQSNFVSDETGRVFSEFVAFLDVREEVAEMAIAVQQGLSLDDSALDQAIRRSYSIVSPFVREEATALLRRVEELVASVQTEEIRARLSHIRIELQRLVVEDERWRRLVSIIEESDSVDALRQQLVDESDILTVAEPLVAIKVRSFTLRPMRDWTVEETGPDYERLGDAAEDLGKAVHVVDEVINWAVDDRQRVPVRLLLAGKSFYDQFKRNRVIPAENVLGRLLDEAIPEFRDSGTTFEVISSIEKRLLNGDTTPLSPTGALRDQYNRLELIGASVAIFFNAIDNIEDCRSQEELEEHVGLSSWAILGIYGVPHLTSLSQRWNEVLDARRVELNVGDAQVPAVIQEARRGNEIVGGFLAQANDPENSDEQITQLLDQFNNQHGDLRGADCVSEHVRHHREVRRISNAVRCGIDFGGSQFENVVRDLRNRQWVEPIDQAQALALAQSMSDLFDRSIVGMLIIDEIADSRELEALIKEDEKWRELIDAISNSVTVGDMLSRLRLEHSERALAAARRLVSIKSEVLDFQQRADRSIEGAAADLGTVMRIMEDLEVAVADLEIPDRLLQAGVDIYVTLMDQKIMPVTEALVQSIEAAIPTFPSVFAVSETFGRIFSILGAGDGRAQTELRNQLVRLERGIVWYKTHTDQLMIASPREFENLVSAELEQRAVYAGSDGLSTLRDRWEAVRDQRQAELHLLP